MKEDNPRLGGMGGGLEGIVAANRDGSRIAVGSRYQRNNDGATAVVIDATTNQVVTIVKPGQSNYIRTVLSDDGKLLATFGQYYERKPNDENWAAIVQVWDATTGAEKFRVKTGAAYQVQTAAFSPDGQLLVTATPNSPVQAWDTATGKFVRQYVSRSGIGQGLFFSPDGSKLAGAATGRHRANLGNRDRQAARHRRGERPQRRRRRVPDGRPGRRAGDDLPDASRCGRSPGRCSPRRTATSAG